MPNNKFNIQSKTFNSFSGVDIKGVFNNRVMAELQAISYSITREKAPLYTMGAADPRSFSRGKRGIAGTLIFLVFDRHALLGEFGAFAPTDQQLLFQSDKDDKSMLDHTSNSVTIAQQSVNIEPVESGLKNIASDQEVTAAWFVDQLPPFDITLAAANEYGALAVMRIYGVEILNEGYGVSIDDIVSEQQMTYVARTLIGWQPAGSADLSVVTTKVVPTLPTTS